MHENVKYSLKNFLPTWLLLWYFSEFVLLLLWFLVYNFFLSAEQSIDPANDVAKSIIITILWPLIYGFFFSLGWAFLGSEIVGASSSLYLLGEILLIGVLSGIITWTKKFDLTQPWR